MATRSTVKFKEDGQTLLSLYQQYEGYPSGVGAQVAGLLKKYQLVNRLPSQEDSASLANGVQELALFYVLMFKKPGGNIYATTESDSQEFDYEINYSFNTKEMTISVKNNDYMIFEGNKEGYLKYIDDILERTLD